MCDWKSQIIIDKHNFKCKHCTINNSKFITTMLHKKHIWSSYLQYNTYHIKKIKMLHSKEICKSLKQEKGRGKNRLPDQNFPEKIWRRKWEFLA